MHGAVMPDQCLSVWPYICLSVRRDVDALWSQRHWLPNLHQFTGL